jgi:hypothetical protein
MIGICLKVSGLQGFKVQGCKLYLETLKPCNLACARCEDLLASCILK